MADNPFTIVSLLLSAFALKATGIAWAGDEVLSVGTCLWRGTVLGAVGGGVYAIALFGLWSIAGRPDSPERQIVTAIAPAVRRIIGRGRSLITRKRLDAV